MCTVLRVWGPDYALSSYHTLWDCTWCCDWLNLHYSNDRDVYLTFQSISSLFAIIVGCRPRGSHLYVMCRTVLRPGSNWIKQSKNPFESWSREQGHLRSVKIKGSRTCGCILIWPLTCKKNQAIKSFRKDDQVIFCQSKILIPIANTSTGNIQVTTPYQPFQSLFTKHPLIVTEHWLYSPSWQVILSIHGNLTSLSRACEDLQMMELRLINSGS